jgi:hypothetical protein
MAFLQPIEIQETGVCAQYWRLTHVQTDIAAGILEAKMHGFLDETARRSGKSPLSVMAFRMPTEGLMKRGTLKLSDVYNAVRASAAGEDAMGAVLPPVFSAAEDV